MGARMVVAAVSAIMAGFFGCWYLASTKAARETEMIYEPDIKKIEPASPCPWREADQELTNWFPGATRYDVKDIILSGKIAMLREQLGRTLRPEEVALHSYVIFSNYAAVGTVLTRRIKGEHGVVELALALDPEGTIKKFRIQRIREPEEIVRALEEFRLEHRFLGKNVADEFTVEDEPGANSSAADETALQWAKVIAREVKVLLVLYEAGGMNRRRPHH